VWRHASRQSRRRRATTPATAARDVTPSLVNTFERWLSTVFSLSNSSAAISRLLLPAVTSRATSSSRLVRPRSPDPAPRPVRMTPTSQAPQLRRGLVGDALGAAGAIAETGLLQLPRYVATRTQAWMSAR
jgi:hypothetical protein